MMRFAGQEFTQFSVPLVFAGRYFVLEPGQPPKLSVFQEVDGEAIFEVFRNVPVDNPLSLVAEAGAGMVTVSDKATGRFLYKVRPGSETSIAFGKLVGGELSARLTDKQLEIGGVTLQNNTFTGVMTGVMVSADGSVAIGAPLPPAVRRLLGE